MAPPLEEIPSLQMLGRKGTVILSAVVWTEASVRSTNVTTAAEVAGP